MAARTLEIHPTHPEPRKIRQVVDAIRSGQVVLYPTDTVYALGCAIDDKKAQATIRRLKGMSGDQPFALLCSDLKDIARFAQVSDQAYRLMRRLVPGPYTFVLPATREVPRLLLDKRRTVGIRVPSSPIALAICEELQSPLLTSSAIFPGDGSACIHPQDAKDAWKNDLALIIDGGPVPGQVSTVLKLDDEGVEILRHGQGPIDDLD